MTVTRTSPPTTPRSPFGRRAATIAVVAGLALGGLAACEDEDGDGAETDEEVDQVDEKSEDVRDDVEKEVDEGREEVKD